MNRAIVGLILAACGSSSDRVGPAVSPPIQPVAPRSAGSGSSVAVAVDAAISPVPVTPTFVAVEAPPGGKLVRVTVTPADDAALTIDDADEVRLWPALDGTRAPLAVELPMSAEIALQHAGAGFVAFVGVAGGAFEVRLDALGHRVAVHELPAIDGVAALDTGFVIWRRTQLQWLDVDGGLGPLLDAKAQITGVAATPDGGVATVGGAPRRLERHGAELVLGGPASTPAAPRVAIAGSDLVIVGAAGRRYLGYAYPANAPPAGVDADHLLVGGGAGRWLELDATLAPIRELVPWTPPGGGATSLTWIGGDDWLVQSPAGVSLWTVGQAGTLVLPRAKLQEVDVESHLVLLADNHLARYVPARHAVESIVFTGWGDASTEAHLLTPSLAHGAMIVISGFDRDQQGVEHGSVRWIHDLEHPEHGDKRWYGHRAWSTEITRGGQAIISDHEPDARWSIVDDGHPAVAFPGEVALAPDGARYVVTDPDARTLALFALDGKAAWSTAIPGTDRAGTAGAAWLDPHHLMFASPHGFAMVDAATGALGPARSGWRFELGDAPHPLSTVGRPLASEVAAGRDAPLALRADAAFQNLVGEVAGRTSARLTGWGLMHLEDVPVRVAMLQAQEETGSPLFAIVVDAGGGAAIIVTVTALGFPELQGPFPPGDPVWGTAWYGQELTVVHTMDLDTLEVASKWIHGSGERLVIARARGTFVVASDDWTERENNGHGFDESAGHHDFPAGHRPRLVTFKAHVMRFAISAPSSDPDTLASVLHEIPAP